MCHAKRNRCINCWITDTQFLKKAEDAAEDLKILHERPDTKKDYKLDTCRYRLGSQTLQKNPKPRCRIFVFLHNRSGELDTSE